MRLFYENFVKTALIKFGAFLVANKKNNGYIAVSSAPSVIFIIYVLLEKSATSMYAFSSFIFWAISTSEEIVRTVPFLILIDKSLLYAISIEMERLGGAWLRQVDFVLFPQRNLQLHYGSAQLSCVVGFTKAEPLMSPTSKRLGDANDTIRSSLEISFSYWERQSANWKEAHYGQKRWTHSPNEVLLQSGLTSEYEFQSIVDNDVDTCGH